MTTKERFLNEYEMVKMNKNSITLRRQGNSLVYIHRNVFNEIMNDNAVDYVEEQKPLCDWQIQYWVKALIWKSI